jgi:hypothetical protein
MPKIKDAAPILFDTINNKKRHLDYDHVVNLAKDYTAYATGKGMADYLKRFNLRETEEAFQQRLTLTQVNTPDIVSRLKKPIAKVNRTPATFNIAWDGKDAQSTIDKKKQLVSVGQKFWGDKSVEKYFTQRLADLDTLDCNSFLVIEFKENVDKKNPEVKANPYPFEVNSAEAVNFQYINNVLQWLIVLNATIMRDDKGNPSAGELYYEYTENETIKATEIHPTTVDAFRLANPRAIEINAHDPNLVMQPKQIYLYSTGKEEEKGQSTSPSSKRWFVMQVFEHKVGFVPAKRIGTHLDPETRFRTCVPVIHAAKCYLEKSIKAMSEMDLTMILHTFPQKIQYADPCDGFRSEGQLVGCIKGKTAGGDICKSCSGTGFKGHVSAQDVIQIRMPREVAEMVSLENIMVYKHPPIDLLKFQQEHAFDLLINTSISAVYNSQIFSQRKIAETATGENIDLDAVYDTLKDFADNSSEFYVFAYKVFASLRSMSQGLVVTHNFPSDFKMQSLNSLLDDLEKANKNNAPSHVKTAINKKIVGKIYADQPGEVLKIETKNKYYPFQGKSEAEIALILASGYTTRFNQVFYSHFDLVFSDLEYQTEQRQLNFYDMEETMQRTLISAKVTEIMNQIDLDSNGAIDGELAPAAPTPEEVEADTRAKLRGSKGAVDGILAIQNSFANKTTDRDSAIAMLETVYGFTPEEASRLLGAPKIITLPKPGFKDENVA